MKNRSMNLAPSAMLLSASATTSAKNATAFVDPNGADPLNVKYSLDINGGDNIGSAGGDNIGIGAKTAYDEMEEVGGCVAASNALNAAGLGHASST